MEVKKIVKVKYIKNDKYSYETTDDLKPNDFVWCKVKDRHTDQEYEQLAIVTDVCTIEEAARIREQLANKGIELKSAKRYIKKK